MIEIRHLSKTYNKACVNEVKVLHDINLTVNKGDEISIIGKSGSGKSTLLHIMALIDRFQDGDLLIDNISVRQKNEQEIAYLRNNNIGLILQDFALIPEYTVIENILLPTMFSKEKKRNKLKRAKELLEQVGLADKSKQYAALLSGGQKQRVAVCRALINDPSIILADEPTGALDTINGAAIISLLKNISNDNKALVVITHDMEIAQNFKRQLLLKDGVLEVIK